MGKMITLDIAQTRIDKKHGIGEITIVPESYTGIANTMEFSCCVKDHKPWNTKIENIYNRGTICPECSKILRRPSYKSIQVDIDKKHGSGIIFMIEKSYTDPSSQAEFRCHNISHPNWWTTPSAVSNRSGCKKCSNERNSTSQKIPLDVIQSRIKDKHGDNIILHVDTFIMADKLARFSCHNINHKDWEATPSNVYNCGCGCPACATSGFDQSKPAIVYYFQDIVTCEYKFGISNRTVFERFSKIYRNRIRLIKVWNFNTGKEALNFEQEIHKSYNFYRTDNISWRNIDPNNSNGSTEFFFDDILNLDDNPLPIFGSNTLDLKTKI